MAMTSSADEATDTGDGDSAASACGPDVRKLDSRSLQGLAHPLRVRLFEQLTYYGPATATQLAERLGESSGSTSYHLRQLAKFGFVEEDAERGNQRDRWWRRVPGAIQWSELEFRDDPVGRAAAELLDDQFEELTQRRRQGYWDAVDRWPPEWVASVMAHTMHIVLSAEEAGRMGRDLQAVFDRYKRRFGGRDLVPVGERDAELSDVDVQLTLLPVSAPPVPLAADRSQPAQRPTG